VVRVSAGLRSFAVLLAVLAAPAGEPGMPSWILPGILAVESSSYYADGAIVYVNRRVGAAGELGPFQITRAAYLDVATSAGLRATFRTLKFSTRIGEIVATLILERHHVATGSWAEAVIRYHVGARGDRAEGERYLDQVRAAGLAYLRPRL
jgi:hypothetical protein